MAIATSAIVTIPINARDYTGYMMKLKEGYSLWGTATGSIPYHRQWWIVSPSGEVFYLDQGCYEDSGPAAKARYMWAKQIGAAD